LEGAGSADLDFVLADPGKRLEEKAEANRKGRISSVLNPALSVFFCPFLPPLSVERQQHPILSFQ
jgi:threonine/homoserine/homoserine lactone efflux protein